MLSACGKDYTAEIPPETPPIKLKDYPSITGMIIDINKEGTEAYVVNFDKLERYVVHIKEMSKELKVGSEVKIYYETIMESDPMQINPKDIEILRQHNLDVSNYIKIGDKEEKIETLFGKPLKVETELENIRYYYYNEQNYAIKAIINMSDGTIHKIEIYPSQLNEDYEWLP